MPYASNSMVTNDSAMTQTSHCRSDRHFEVGQDVVFAVMTSEAAHFLAEYTGEPSPSLEPVRHDERDMFCTRADLAKLVRDLQSWNKFPIKADWKLSVLVCYMYVLLVWS